MTSCACTKFYVKIWKSNSFQEVPISSNIFSSAAELTGPIDYVKIYKYLADVTMIRKPTRDLNPIEAAIVLKIMDDIQEMADTGFDRLVDFFRQMLHDVKDMSGADLRPLTLPNETEMGKAFWNVFDLPDDLMNLSLYLPPDAPGEQSATTFAAGDEVASPSPMETE